MPGSTSKGAPYSLGSDTAATIDDSMKALAEWVDARPGVSPITTAARDALAGADLWDGRVIWNLTTARLERYNAGTTSWLPAGDLKTIRIPHTWGITDEIKVAVGDADYITPFWVSLPAGQTARFRGGRARINSGTSVTFDIRRNGTAISAGQVATPTAASFANDVALADNDQLELVVTAVSGTPRNLSVTIFIEYTS